MGVQRFHSPFKHWLSGLFAEVAAFLAFMTAVAVIVAVLVRVL